MIDVERLITARGLIDAAEDDPSPITYAMLVEEGVVRELLDAAWRLHDILNNPPGYVPPRTAREEAYNKGAADMADLARAAAVAAAGALAETP